MKFNSIKETAVYVSDLQQSQEFYNGILGLPVITKVDGQHVFFRAGNSILLCFIAEHSRNKKEIPPHFGKGNLHFALECQESEYEAWKALVEKNGIEIEQEIVWKSGGKSFYFRDPDHHSVEIIEPGIWDY